tara:strand:- start:86 stop:1060 length:975 start_codon:yes stop_codon:yes gene_type:complete
MYSLRFDMRAPINGLASTSDLYKAALDMSRWGEKNGCFMVMASEHHASPDGYLPSPIIFATAIAAQTTTIPINIGALLLNMYEPVKLAEDMVVLDIISNGRVSYIIGLGYRKEEYDMFGVQIAKRANIIEDKIEVLLKALKGAAFDYDGRRVHVTPGVPGQPISIAYGGHSVAAAKRAGKFGLNLFANGGEQSLSEVYIDAATEAGHKPGFASIPTAGSPTTVYVAENLDKAWEEYGPYMLYDAKMYDAWGGSYKTSNISKANTFEEMREEKGAYQILTPEQAVACIHGGQPLMLQPLCGGCPPKLAWQSLETLANKVLPALDQ